tara:strand:+ start:188 stop:499 length:312 start_codon:yes stop_codon:yes gene_type:complete
MKKNLKFFIIKYSVISAVLTWVISNDVTELIKMLTDSIIHPFFSIDINKDGESDLKKIREYVSDINGVKFAYGKLILKLIQTTITLLLIYLIIKFFINYTDIF